MGDQPMRLLRSDTRTWGVVCAIALVTTWSIGDGRQSPTPETLGEVPVRTFVTFGAFGLVIAKETASQSREVEISWDELLAGPKAATTATKNLKVKIPAKKRAALVSERVGPKAIAELDGKSLEVLNLAPLVEVPVSEVVLTPEELLEIRLERAPLLGQLVRLEYGNGRSRLVRIDPPRSSFAVQPEDRNTFTAQSIDLEGGPVGGKVQQPAVPPKTKPKPKKGASGSVDHAVTGNALVHSKAQGGAEAGPRQEAAEGTRGEVPVRTMVGTGNYLLIEFDLEDNEQLDVDQNVLIWYEAESGGDAMSHVETVQTNARYLVVERKSRSKAWALVVTDQCVPVGAPISTDAIKKR